MNIYGSDDSKTKSIAEALSGPTKRTPESWLTQTFQFTGITIMDPDGWDRENFEKSWAEPITREEMQRRVNLSTVLFKAPVLPDVEWDECDDGAEGEFESVCGKFKTSPDPTYGYFRLYRSDDPSESLGEHRSLEGITQMANKVRAQDMEKLNAPDQDDAPGI